MRSFKALLLALLILPCAVLLAEGDQPPAPVPPASDLPPDDQPAPEAPAPEPAPAPAEPAPAPAPVQPDPVPSPAPVAAYPFEAEVNAAKVRVRAGGNINEREMILLSKGDRVTVLEEQYGWYRIRCPHGCKGWIHAKLTTEVPGPVNGAQRVELTADQVVLRASDSLKASSLGTFAKGTVFDLVRRQGEWCQVLCPPEAAAWINAKYVTPLNGVVPPPLTSRPEPVPAPAPAPAPTPEPKPEPAPAPVPADEAGARRWAELERERMRLADQDLQKGDLAGLSARYAELAASTQDALLAERCRARITELKERQRLRDDVKDGILGAREALQKELEAINARYEARLREILEERQKPRKLSDYAETGWLGGVGRMMGCPAGHRLSKGGKHLCFLKSDKDEKGMDRVNLERFNSQYVGVIADRVFDPTWGDVLIVREVHVLDEPAAP